MRSLFAPIVPFVRAADVAVRRPWHIPNRRLLDYLLVGIEAGTCTLIVEGVAHVLTPGDFVLVQPGELHSFDARVSTTTPYAHFDVFYNARREEGFATPAGLVDLRGYEHLVQPRLSDLAGVRVPTRFRPSCESRFRDAFLRTLTLSQSADSLDVIEAQGLVTELVALLLRDFTAATWEPPPSSLHWVTSHMSLQLGEQLTVNDLAVRAHLSPSRFAAVFRRQFGIPPHRYLTGLRVQHARSLLATTDMTQAEIAGLCGFTDVSHFHKTFRRASGCTPGQYREMASSHGRIQTPHRDAADGLRQVLWS